MDRIKQKLQSLREADKQIVKYNNENIKNNRGSIQHTGQILAGMIGTFQKEIIHQSELNAALASIYQLINSIGQNMGKY